MPDLTDVPEDNHGPPNEIREDTCVMLFMALRLCYPPLPLHVTVGAEDCAMYDFQCRSSFMVGRTRFLPENPTEEDEGRYHELVTGRRIEEVQGILEEIFTEEEMVVLWRVRLEMIYANPVNMVGPAVREQQQLLNPPVEVVVLEDDEDMDIETPPHMTGQQTAVIDGDNTIANNLDNMGRDDRSLVELYMEKNMALPMGRTEHAPLLFDIASDGHFGDNGANAEIRRLQAKIDAMYDDPSAQMSHATSSMLSTEGSTSSTGSSGEICLMTDFETQHEFALLPPEPHEIPNESIGSQTQVSRKGKEPMLEDVGWRPVKNENQNVIGETSNVPVSLTELFGYDSRLDEPMGVEMGDITQTQKAVDSNVSLSLSLKPGAPSGSGTMEDNAKITDEDCHSSSDDDPTVGGF